MRKNIIKSLIALSFVLLFNTGCEDYLQLTPKDDLVQDEFWQNKEQVGSAVAGCYASMNQSGFTDRILLWGEARAEMLVSVRAGSTTENLLKNYVISTNSLVSWSNFYKTINYCNTVLAFADQAKENDPTFTEFDLKRYKAEVTAIRSLVYFILVKNFKEVPLVIEATLSDQSDFYPAKSTEDEVLEHIIADLKKALVDLPESYTQSVKHDKGRMTKGAVNALLADIYLWANRYDECIDACQEVINSGKYTLVDGTEWFSSIFFEGNSAEGIFELQFDDLFTTLKNNFYVGNPILAPFGGISQIYADDLNDIRADRASYDLIDGSVFKYAGVDAKSGLFRSATQFYNTWIFYRYADVLLMQAEAYLLSPTQQDIVKAQSLINQVHLRATGSFVEADLSQASLLDALLVERQKEFAFEAKRWYDLLRYERRIDFDDPDAVSLIRTMAELKTNADNYEEIMSYYSDSASYFLPIYQDEVDLNRNLEQNPFYINY